MRRQKCKIQAGGYYSSLIQKEAIVACLLRLHLTPGLFPTPLASSASFGRQFLQPPMHHMALEMERLCSTSPNHFTRPKFLRRSGDKGQEKRLVGLLGTGMLGDATADPHLWAGYLWGESLGSIPHGILIFYFGLG